jgi:hypothetical protein
MQNPLAAAALRLAQSAQQTNQGQCFAPLTPAEVEAVKAQVSIPPDLLAWYKTTAPRDFEIPTLGNRPLLHDPTRLAEAQRGYKFHGSTGERLLDWDETWMVFGGEGSYPLVVEAPGLGDSTIFYAEARRGKKKKRSWHLLPLSTNLEGFLLGLSAFIDLYTVKYSGAICDDDAVLLSSFSADFTAALNTQWSTAGRGDHWIHGWLGM